MERIEKNQKDAEEDVNYQKLIEEGKKLIVEEKNYLNGEYFLNLALLASHIDPQSKINVLAIKSHVYSNLKNLNNLLNYAKKILKQDTKINIEHKFDYQTNFCLARILYRAGMNCENIYTNYSLYFLTLSKNILNKTYELRNESESIEAVDKAAKGVQAKLTKFVIIN